MSNNEETMEGGANALESLLRNVDDGVFVSFFRMMYLTKDISDVKAIKLAIIAQVYEISRKQAVSTGLADNGSLALAVDCMGAAKYLLDSSDDTLSAIMAIEYTRGERADKHLSPLSSTTIPDDDNDGE